MLSKNIHIFQNLTFLSPPIRLTRADHIRSLRLARESFGNISVNSAAVMRSSSGGVISRASSSEASLASMFVSAKEIIVKLKISKHDDNNKNNLTLN